MAGRPRKIIQMSTRKIAKTQREMREEQEGKLKLGRDQLTPPSWLDRGAKKEFRRVADEFAQIGILDNLDLAVLAMYAHAYSHMQTLAKSLNKDGDIRETDGFRVTASELNAYEKYSKILMQCSAKLGLSTVDRLKLVTPVEKEKKVNKYLRFLDDG